MRLRLLLLAPVSWIHCLDCGRTMMNGYDEQVDPISIQLVLFSLFCTWIWGSSSIILKNVLIFSSYNLSLILLFSQALLLFIFCFHLLHFSNYFSYVQHSLGVTLIENLKYLQCKSFVSWLDNCGKLCMTSRQTKNIKTLSLLSFDDMKVYHFETWIIREKNAFQTYLFFLESYFGIQQV